VRAYIGTSVRVLHQRVYLGLSGRPFSHGYVSLCFWIGFLVVPMILVWWLK
jgi:hypothetical protein